MIDLLIKLGLTLLGVHVSARRSKHAALSRIGRSRSSWFYAAQHYGARVSDVMPASLLIERLRAERAALAAA